MPRWASRSSRSSATKPTMSSAALAHHGRPAVTGSIVVTGDSDLLQLVDDNITGRAARCAADLARSREFDKPPCSSAMVSALSTCRTTRHSSATPRTTSPAFPASATKPPRRSSRQYGSLEKILADMSTRSRLPGREMRWSSTVIESAQEQAPGNDRARSGDRSRSRRRAGRPLRPRGSRRAVPRAGVPFVPQQAARLHRGTTHPSSRSLCEPRPESIKTVVDSDGELDGLLKRIKETGEIAVDVETTSTDPMRADAGGHRDCGQRPANRSTSRSGTTKATQLSSDLVRDAPRSGDRRSRNFGIHPPRQVRPAGAHPARLHLTASRRSTR